MNTYMHCRPCYGTNMSTYPTSFVFMSPNYNSNLNHYTYIPASYNYHDQATPLPPSPPPPPPLPPPPPIPSPTGLSPRRRRRLQDPITTYASNYYTTLPRQMPKAPPQQSSSPSPSPLSISQPPSLSTSRRNGQRSNRNGLYCDLYNLLELSSSPSPPPVTSNTRQRKKYNNMNSSPGRHHHHHATDFENAHSRSKNTNDRKDNHRQSHYSKERKRQDDKLSSTEQYDRLAEKTNKTNDIYQRRSPNKGFFRRIVRNYFCIPSTFANNGYSS